MTKYDIAKMIDHTILKPAATVQEIQTLCTEAKLHGFASVCVNPVYVALASEILAGTDVKVCTVVGFPLGASVTAVKVFEARTAVASGAMEIDMVLDIGAVKSNDMARAQADVQAVVDAVHAENGNALVKVIIETCLLTDDEKTAVCEMLLTTGAEFVKTSTGFGTGGATVADVARMKLAVGAHMLIKASGGVKSLEDFRSMREAGADRIGTSSGVAIIEAL